MSYVPGQFVYLNIPSISAWQWHPFTITSIPEDGYISLHIRTVGDWTEKCGLLLASQNINESNNVVLNRMKLKIDGPFGSPGIDSPSI